tara:strand:- start:2264 stop:2797 length:534 start_codon:yes stop_codon:yes gene_type:complete
MIKLKSLLDEKTLKLLKKKGCCDKTILVNPKTSTNDNGWIEIDLSDITDHEWEEIKLSENDDWKDDDDTNMNDEEWEEFNEYLNGWLNDIRQRKLSKKMIDVDELITEFMLMDGSTREVLDQMTDQEINTIRKRLHQKRKDGDTCYFYKRYGIKYLGDRGKLKYDWEKDYYNKHHKR